MLDVSVIADYFTIIGTPGILVIVALEWYRIGRLENRVRGQNGGGIEGRIKSIEENCIEHHGRKGRKKNAS